MREPEQEEQFNLLLDEAWRRTARDPARAVHGKAVMSFEDACLALVAMHKFKASLPREVQ